MGESFSTLSRYTEDTRYDNARQTFKHTDKETQKLVEEFLQEQEKLQRDNERLTKENKKLMDDNRILSNEKESALTR